MEMSGLRLGTFKLWSIKIFNSFLDVIFPSSLFQAMSVGDKCWVIKQNILTEWKEGKILQAVPIALSSHLQSMKFQGKSSPSKNESLRAERPRRSTEFSPVWTQRSANKFTSIFLILQSLTSSSTVLKAVNGKNIAYFGPEEVRLPVGSRVIAVYEDKTVKTRWEFHVYLDKISLFFWWVLLWLFRVLISLKVCSQSGHL